MSISESEITDRLTAKHLKDEIPENTEDLKQTIEITVDEKKWFKDDPKMEKKYTFSINWKDAHGKLWEGTFVNKILSIRERQMVGVMRSRLGNALPPEALDVSTQELNLMIAHLSFSLEKKPDWAEDLRDLDHVELLQNIYVEVMAHEATFFGRELHTSEG